MIYVITHPAVMRSQYLHRWQARALTFTLSAIGGSVAAGTLLAAAGSTIASRERLAIAASLGIVAVGVGCRELAGRPLPLLQRNRETSRKAMSRGALRWAAANGVTLGIGATTRIGFAIWYLVPAGAFVVGNPLLGAAIYGAYGLVRGLAPWPLIVIARRAQYDIRGRLVRLSPEVRTAAGVVLIGVGAALAVSAVSA